MSVFFVYLLDTDDMHCICLSSLDSTRLASRRPRRAASLMVCVSGYSPLDFTVLDPHWGTLADWQAAIDEIHSRGMYFMADFTVGTMADLLGFDGYVTSIRPLSASVSWRAGS